MISLIFGEVASNIGGAFFGNSGESVGLGIGKFLGKQLHSAVFKQKSHHKEGYRLYDVNIQTATYGRNIPIIYGSARLAGNIIWASNYNETASYHSQKLDMFGINEASKTTYHYKISLAIAVAEGEIEEISRIWTNGKQYPMNLLNFRFYKGTEEQMPDPLLIKLFGSQTPAYRGISYIVLEDLPLEQFGNKIPNFTFEVKRKLNFRFNEQLSLEEQIRSMIIIPGSGEFVYDTIVQKKSDALIINDNVIRVGMQNRINENNDKNKADALVSLDQLADSCPNLKWTSPVVGWFGTSESLNDCNIVPGVEYLVGGETSPDSWSVAGMQRSNAYQINKDKFGCSIYGGTSNDASFVRYLDELKSRGYNIMLNPMFFMDTAFKPWRGRLTGKAEDVRNFFYKPKGYKNFILHYARLSKGKIDAFLIGSELIGLTKIHENNIYPAVDCLIELAKEVKNILGKDVQVGYAADWSEYHHTEGGVYNLDPLWACKDIDFVGIDAYFPITDFEEEQYSSEKIKKGWKSGEGFDYCIENNVKKKLSPEYAWKNIDWWWANEHFNPDGTKTSWVPKSKKIWFTEMGFPSVDLCSNQPNVFYDPTSKEGGFPRSSSGAIDFMAQRVALSSSIDLWKQSEMIENIFIWCWDARPFPFWPDNYQFWNDGGCWSRGHWLNGKLGLSSLAAVVADICQKAGIMEDEIDVSQLQDFVEGYVIGKQITAREAIEQLQRTYFFDVIEDNGKLKFCKRINKIPLKVNQEELIPHKLEGGGWCDFKITRTEEMSLPTDVKLVCMDKSRNYDYFVESASLPIFNTQRTISIPTSQIFGREKSRLIAKTILDNLWQTRNIYNFILPVKYSYLKVGDLIEIVGEEPKIMRIITLCFKEKRLTEVNAVLEDNRIYKHSIYEEEEANIAGHLDPGNTILHILDIPFLPFEIEKIPRVLLAAEGEEINWNGAIVRCPGGINQTLYRHPIGVLLADIIDDKFTLSIRGAQLNSIASDDNPMQNIAIIGNEIIRFCEVKNTTDNMYEISKLQRGLFGTKIAQHSVGEKLIILNQNLKIAPLADMYIGRDLEFEAVSIGRRESFANKFIHKFNHNK